jgi:hypothetical protein
MSKNKIINNYHSVSFNETVVIFDNKCTTTIRGDFFNLFHRVCQEY